MHRGEIKNAIKYKMPVGVDRICLDPDFIISAGKKNNNPICGPSETFEHWMLDDINALLLMYDNGIVLFFK